MNNQIKVTLPWIKQPVGLGDLVKQLVDPKGVNTRQAFERQRLALNAILTFTGTPVQNQPQQPKPRPSDWQQMYNVTDDERLPDGG